MWQDRDAFEAVRKPFGAIGYTQTRIADKLRLEHLEALKLLKVLTSDETKV